MLKYERCLPIIYKPRGKEEAVERQLALVNSEFQAMEAMLNESIYPIKVLGKRTSCCCYFTSLFHEDKQMGIVLRKAFKGTHLWIPSIEK